MLSSLIKYFGVLFFMLGTMAWISGGARIGLTRDSKMIIHFDELLEMETVENIAVYEPGIEYLATGSCILLFSILISITLTNKKNQKTQNTI